MVIKLNQPERSLRESPDALADIIGSVMDAIIAVDDAQRIVLFNAAAEKMFGCRADEVMGSSVERFIPPRFRARHSARVREFDKSGVTNRALGGLGTLWGLRANGEEFPIEASISRVESGDKKFFTVIIRDITERKLSEETLQRSEERFRLAAQAGKMFAYEWDAATDLISRSPESAQILGVDETVPITGQQALAKVHPDDREKLKDALTALTPEKPYLHLSYRIIRPDNTVIWVERSSCAHFDENGKLLRIVGMVADITERHRTEEALRESEERMRLAQQAAAIGVFERNLQTGKSQWSPEMEAIFGLSHGKTPETIEDLMQLIHPEDRVPLQRLIDDSIETGTAAGEWRVIWPDGSIHWVAGRWRVFKDSEGRPLRALGVDIDITQRKQAEEALRESEERLRLAQWAAHIGTFDLNLRTGVDIWSPEMEALYGLAPGSFGRTLAAFENLIHPDDRQRIRELTQEMLRTGQPAVGEWRAVWPDGSVHWIAGRGQVLMDELGVPSRMLGVNIDFTERKLAETNLATANERLHLALESGAVGGWDYCVNTSRNVWFGKAHAQLGMSPDETSGLHEKFWARVHPDDRERLKHALQVAKEKSQEFAEEFRVVWRDGTIHWLRSRGRYQYDANGQPERMLGISVDITENKEAEQALRDSEQRFRLAAQTGKMYSFEWDVLTDVVIRSPERFKVLGTAEPLQFTNRQFLETIHPDDRPKFSATIAGLTPKNPTAEVIFRVRGSDNGFVWLKSNGRAFFDSQGKMQRVIGMVADVTDLKRAEEQLSAMARKLIESQEQERVRIGRELHDDINQRLAMLSLELVELPENPSEIQSRVSALRRQMAEISSDVQALSHDLHSSKLEYLGVVAGMKSWCTEFAQRQKLEIHFSSHVTSVLSPETGVTLFRVLQEASSNALKHSGVKRVDVILRENSGEIHLIIGDSGRGFDVESALRGGGLGLTSMRERVRLINGTIGIESKPMCGTTIHVRVPLPPENVSERAVG